MANWASEWCQPGQVIVDVGANVGTFTREFIEAVGVSGVWAIEPHPDCQHDLRQCLPASQIIQAAVTDTDGETVLHRSARTEHGSLYASNVLEAHGSLPVRAVTLDGLQARGELPTPIALVKVDAQGAEMAILRGAETLIRTQHPMWFLELWPQGLQEAGTSAGAVIQLLREAGYALVNHGSWEHVIRDCTHMTGHSSLDILVRAGAEDWHVNSVV
jgi:FkbM family methyltransferase